jgi:hypothetical protein
MKTRYLYILFSAVFLLFISCTQKEKNVAELEPLVENLEKNIVEIEPHTENLGNNMHITIGDVVFFVPSDYYISYFDGDKYESSMISDIQSEKRFYIMTDKNNDFNGADANYTTRHIPLLQNYIDGTGDDMLEFLGQYRRNVYNNIKVAERLSLCENEIINIMFTREISFIYNDIAYRFTIFVDNINTQFINEMEDYFEIKKDYFSNEDPYGWISEKRDELYIKYQNYEELPLVIEQLFIETNMVFSSIKIRK